MSGEIYQNAIDILTSQGKFYINLGLERVQKILEILGNPQDKLKFIHLAGTNGKGSTSAILSSILTSSHQKTGLFTSPHIFEYTERIKINNIDIDKEIFAKKIIEIVKLAEENEIHLTEFEILTVVAFDYFAQNDVEIVVLETGLGGRLDATNVIKKNLCAIITHLDLDHTERLGNTIDEIAFEKAGIIKENCPVITSSNNQGIDVIKKIAEEKNSHFFIAKKAPEKLQKKLALLGIWQHENLALALAAVAILKKQGYSISEEAIEKGLSSVKHPCRFEYFKEENLLIDGAHNPNGTKALRESLDYYFRNENSYKNFRFIFGCLKNKDYPQMMKNLFKNLTKEDEIYFYHFDNPNSCTYEELSLTCNLESKEYKGINRIEKKDNTLTVICGSFYMIKELLQKMGLK